MELLRNSCEGGEPRKRWSAEPPDTVLQALANASLASSHSTTGQNFTSSTHEGMTGAEFNFLKCAKMSSETSSGCPVALQVTRRTAGREDAGKGILLRGS